MPRHFFRQSFKFDPYSFDLNRLYLRVTYADVLIDQAGNIWSINNWKPDIDIDAIGGNPGGDGIIIFVGLAVPPTTQVH